MYDVKHRADVKLTLGYAIQSENPCRRGYYVRVSVTIILY